MLRRPPTQPQTFSNRVRVSREGLLQGDCGPEQWLSLILLFPFQPAMSFSSGGSPEVGAHPDWTLWGGLRAQWGSLDKGAMEGAGATGGSPGLGVLQGSCDPRGCGGSLGPHTGGGEAIGPPSWPGGCRECWGYVGSAGP